MNELRIIERIYAGWLAKVIGVRFGAPVESWTYEEIQHIYGEITGYLVDYQAFAADDDLNGPLFFLRALADSGKGAELSAQDVAQALLNYAPFEHGFFWWSGYGVSTEHTAYLNLAQGIQAPQSGSMALNGAAVAEQIGGQIFADTWGLVNPGNPARAADMARKAASVTHDGNAIYGAMFVAACIAAAFEEQSIQRIMDKGLSFLPVDCEYRRAVEAVLAFERAHPSDWRACYAYVRAHWGYDKYPGVCHVIPNAAVMALAMAYGAGDFSKTLCICNMCGWDTDCNVGNVATIMGVCCGLEGIDYEKWSKPVHDFLACSSVVGSLNITDIPTCASYMAQLAFQLNGKLPPEPWSNIWANGMDACHFEHPTSTHAMRVRRGASEQALESLLQNTDEAAHTGARCLKVHARPLYPGETVYVYKKTYYAPADFHDSRYDPSFSPTAHPGQTLHGSASLPCFSTSCCVRLYAHDAISGEVVLGERHSLAAGIWTDIAWRIPPMDNALIDEVGFAFEMDATGGEVFWTGYVDDFYWEGAPSYSIGAGAFRTDVWTPLHKEVSQFTRFKGLFYEDQGKLHLSCADVGEAYTGRHDWRDYSVQFEVEPLAGQHHYGLVRVQGAQRSYAVGLGENGKLCIWKKEGAFRQLAQTDYPWAHQASYALEIVCVGADITVRSQGQTLLTIRDDESPYLSGSIGLGVRQGSHCACSKIEVRPIRDAEERMRG